MSLLVPLVRKADLSRSEIQILIDLLLNKQHDGPTIIDEWSEVRQQTHIHFIYKYFMSNKRRRHNFVIIIIISNNF